MEIKEEIPLVILAACVSGQGVGLPGGEISGFYRAIAALGARCCMLSFWPVGSFSVDYFASCVIQSAYKDAGSAFESYCKSIQLVSSHDAGWSLGKRIMKVCCLGMFV